MILNKVVLKQEEEKIRRRKRMYVVRMNEEMEMEESDGFYQGKLFHYYPEIQ